jgi:transposase
MAMGKRRREEQQPLWVSHEDLPRSQGHPFYLTLNRVLSHCGFEAWIEEACQPFYAQVMGRPSLAPGVYFRCLLVGYFEGIDSERGIAWRCADSLSLRSFLGIALDQGTPDHSTISRTRRLIDLETHQRVFTWILKVLAAADLIKGKTIGVDATTLEASAALRSIVRNDNVEGAGQGYQEFLTGLAKASGIDTPTREDLAKIDKTRKNKASNDDWHNPFDPDAKIAKMKDGSTHLAHKHEHAVDMGEGAAGAVLAVTVQPADEGDTTTWRETVETACQNVNELRQDPVTAEQVNAQGVEEAVADKGYHSNQVMVDLVEVEIRSYVAEPDRSRHGQRDWEDKAQERDAVYANRRRVKGKRGRRLMRQRGEFLERGFAHALETGGMRRTHLKGRQNIKKRLLVHVGGFNLGLVMRKIMGRGTPRGFQGLGGAFSAPFAALQGSLRRIWNLWVAVVGLRCSWASDSTLSAAA